MIVARACASRVLGIAALVTGWTTPVPAAEGDFFQFFEAEAEVVTAARQPQSLRRAPATVYVVTGREVETSGTQLLWEGLRKVPGVEVMTMRAFNGEVSIRGLDKPLNNRTLVLLDGRTLLNGFFDFVTWDAIPGIAGEIAQIEVVEGPVSALYGPNAINGVINIVSKTPAQLQGGEVGLGLGEGNSQFAHFLYGRQRGRMGYKVGASGRAGDQFEQSGRRASEVAEVHGLLDWNLPSSSRLSLGAGVARLNTQLTTGPSGMAFNDGKAGFAQLIYAHPQVQVQGFWNWGRGVLRQYQLLVEPNMDYDTAELGVEHLAQLPAANRLVVGVNFRYHAMRSKVFQGGKASQNLGALSFEDEWKVDPHLSLVGSGRLDRHPLAGTVFSPRASAVFAPSTAHVLRAAVGTAFRNPNLSENYLGLREDLAVPAFVPLPSNPDSAFTKLQVDIRGNPDLRPERILFFELAHLGQFGRLRTSATGYYYRLDDLSVQVARLLGAVPPVIAVETSFASQGQARAWGGELGAELRWRPGLALAANYAHLHMTGRGDPLTARGGGPAHKLNGGVEFRRQALSGNLWAHWVSSTWWSQDMPVFPGVGYQKVDGYLVVNAWIGYTFTDRAKGVEVGVGAFDLLDNRQYQILPSSDGELPGQHGELLRRRLTATLVQHF